MASPACTLIACCHARSVYRLVLDGEMCLWTLVVEVEESAGYAVCKACNEEKGLPYPLHRVPGPDAAHEAVSRRL
jgi:hypothetical protein